MRALALLSLLALGACDALGGGPDVVTLHVDARTALCQGEGIRQCLWVRESPDDAWALFYDEIEGFAYEPGVAYVLRVEVTEVDRPPADGSSRRYRLVEVVSRTPGG